MTPSPSNQGSADTSSSQNIQQNTDCDPSLIKLGSPLCLSTNQAFNKDCSIHNLRPTSLTGSNHTALTENSSLCQDNMESSLLDSSVHADEIIDVLSPSKVIAAALKPRKPPTEKSWYEAHFERQMQYQDSSSGGHNDDEMKEVNAMLRQYSLAELTRKLYLVQQQLCLYHSLLEKYENSKALRKKLEEKNKKILSEQKKCKTQFNKLLSANKKLKSEVSTKDNQLADLKMELVRTKVQLAQARSQEDHQNLRVMKISDEKKKLKEENKSLRRIASMQSLNGKDPEGDPQIGERVKSRSMRRICSMLSFSQNQGEQMRCDSLPSSSSKYIQETCDTISATDECVENMPEDNEGQDSRGEMLALSIVKDFGVEPAASSPFIGNMLSISALFGSNSSRETQDTKQEHCVPNGGNLHKVTEKRQGKKWTDDSILLHLPDLDTRVLEEDPQK